MSGDIISCVVCVCVCVSSLDVLRLYCSTTMYVPVFRTVARLGLGVTQGSIFVSRTRLVTID